MYVVESICHICSLCVRIALGYRITADILHKGRERVWRQRRDVDVLYFRFTPQVEAMAEKYTLTCV